MGVGRALIRSIHASATPKDEPFWWLTGGMSEPAGLRLSVRGVATRLVAPDEARINGAVELEQPTREQANAALAHATDWMLQQLRALGGAVQTVANRRAPLTWLVSGSSVHEQHYDHGVSFHASAPFSITVRDFTLVDRIVGLLRTGPVNVWNVAWSVDDENPAWREVRAEAIHAAIAKARDYAAALGVSVASIEQIADSGLLASGTEASTGVARFAAAQAVSAGGGDGVTVDPQPQEIAATIEARVVATPVSLT